MKQYNCKRKNVILIIVAVLFFIAGVVILLINPIRSAKRMKVTNEALESIEAQIKENSANTDNTEPSAITIVVSKYGNEVAGEEYDYYTDEDNLDELMNEVAEMEANLPDNITLTCIGILKIDKIDLNLPIWDQTSRVALRYGLGLYEDSVAPGMNGNTSILGHRNQHTSTMFWRLKEVTAGDIVRILLPSGNELSYRVRQVKFVGPSSLIENIEASASSSPQLTLVTCATERGQGHRRLVICDPI